MKPGPSFLIYIRHSSNLACLFNRTSSIWYRTNGTRNRAAKPIPTQLRIKIPKTADMEQKNRYGFLNVL